MIADIHYSHYMNYECQCCHNLSTDIAVCHVHVCICTCKSRDRKVISTIPLEEAGECVYMWYWESYSKICIFPLITLLIRNLILIALIYGYSLDRNYLHLIIIKLTRKIIHWFIIQSVRQFEGKEMEYMRARALELAWHGEIVNAEERKMKENKIW